MTTGQSPARALTSLQLGATKAVITPPVGSELSGFIARTAPMAGVHDELYARALVFAGEGAAERAALVTLDAIDLNAATVAAIRERAAALTSIPGERIGVTCTHTHGGPATLAGRWLGHADDAYLDVPFTNDIRKMEQGLARIDSRGSTAMRDAINMSLDYMNKQAKKDKKVILIITDGNDNASNI
ncbi:MAG: VWA domain-containing protein, partial [Thermomicrobiales bacterium]